MMIMNALEKRTNNEVAISSTGNFSNIENDGPSVVANGKFCLHNCTRMSISISEMVYIEIY